MLITRIGGPTVVIELHGWRILVDPTFDPPGGRYDFALGTSSVKTTAPAIPASGLGRIDLVLVSHDHHADNLDDAGRALLASSPRVVTTASGARRLGLPHAQGLTPGGSLLLEAPDRDPLQITATPCRHGPPLSRAIVGDVIGFAIRRPGARIHDVWITGDSVLYRGLRKVAASLTVDVAVVHAGGVRFGLTGPVRYTMTGRDAVRLVGLLRPRLAVAAHFDGWSHFRDGEAGMRAAIRRAGPDVESRFRWLPDGERVDLGAPKHGLVE